MQAFYFRVKLNGATILLILTAFLGGCGNNKHKDDHEIETLIFQDHFNGGLNHWITEVVPDSTVNIGIIDEQLVIDTDRGVTLWLNQELTGNIRIRYKRQVVMKEGPNDRLSDMNQFWMATDPRNPTLFTRDGAFKEYDSLLMYYAGIGGNNNETTRFRKYTGDGNRVLIHDLTDDAYLLKPNHIYQIEIVVKDGVTSLSVDNREYFRYEDDKPLTKGYFGIRTTGSRQIIDDVEIFKLK